MSWNTVVPVPLPLVEELTLELIYFGLTGPTLFIAFCTIALRMLVRVAQSKSGIDDYLIVVSWISAFFGLFTNVNAIANGVGAMIGPPKLEESLAVAKWNLMMEIQYFIGTSLTKISFCFFILRFLDRVKQRTKRFTYGLIIVVAATGLGFVIAVLLQCQPVKKMYTPSLPGTCHSPRFLFGIAYAQGAISIITNFTCALLPISIVGRLQMKRRTKIAVSLVFSLGIITALFSVVRTALLYQSFQNGLLFPTLLNAIFAMLEQNIGIIAASLPILRPVISRILPASQNPNDRTRLETNDIQRPFVIRMAPDRDGEEGDMLPYPAGTTRKTAFKVENNVYESHVE